MKGVFRPNLRTFLRWLLGILFLWAAVSKLANPTEFLASIYAYRLPIPKPVLQFVAVVLPWVELLCGLLLIGKVWTESALACATGLMILFVLATGQAWVRQLDISCGCFDFKILGLDAANSKFVKFFESVTFAFFRNALLAGIAYFLLSRRLSELRHAFLVQQQQLRLKPMKRNV